MHSFGFAWAADETWWDQWVLSEDLPHSNSLISGPVRVRGSHRCCSEVAHLSFVQYLHGIICWGRGCTNTQKLPSITFSPSSLAFSILPSNLHFLPFQRLPEKPFTVNRVLLAPGVCSLLKVHVYFDFPLTETTAECCHFTSRTLRVQGLSEHRLIKQKWNLNKSAIKKISWEALALQLLWLKSTAKAKRKELTFVGTASNIRCCFSYRCTGACCSKLHPLARQEHHLHTHKPPRVTAKALPFQCGQQPTSGTQENLVDWAGNYRELFLKCKWDSATFISFLL